MIIPVGNKKDQKYTTYQNLINNDEWLKKLAVVDVGKLPPEAPAAEAAKPSPELQDTMNDSQSPQLNPDAQKPKFDPQTGEALNTVGPAELFNAIQKSLKANSATSDLDIVGFNTKGGQYTLTLAPRGVQKVVKQ